MTKDEYVIECNLKLNRYVTDVTEGNIIICKTIRQSIERYQYFLNWNEVEWRQDKVDWFWKFCYYINIEQQGIYKRFHPEPWQIFYFSNIYGWYEQGTDIRYFDNSYLTQSRKNGKTHTGVIQSLFHLMLDGITDAKVITISESKTMSTDSALFFAKQIVANSEDIDDVIETRQYALRYTNGKSISEFKLYPNKSAALNGIKPTFGLLDELHTHVTSNVFDMLENGMMASFNHLISIITTRGDNTTYFQYEYEESLKQILNNNLESRCFIMIFELDKKEEMNDPEMWIKSNPNLGVTFDIKELHKLYDKAKLIPAKLKSFYTYNLNMWVDFLEDSWLDLKTINKNMGKIHLKNYDNWVCWLGGDFSSVQDLSSITVLFRNEKLNKFIVHPLIYISNNPQKKVRKGGIDLHKIINDKWIKECSDDVIDYKMIYDDIKILAEKYDIQKFGYDKNNVSLFMKQVSDDILGDKLQDVGQGFWLNEPLKFMEREFLSGNILFENPAFKWQLQNVRIVTNEQSNIKAGKTKSKDSIDTIISTACAFQMYIDEQKEQGNFNFDLLNDNENINYN